MLNLTKGTKVKLIAVSNDDKLNGLNIGDTFTVLRHSTKRKETYVSACGIDYLLYDSQVVPV